MKRFINLMNNLRRPAAIAATFMALLLMLSFAFRNIFLQKALSVLNRKLQAHHYVASWQGARFAQLSNIYIRKLEIRNIMGPDRIVIDSLNFRLRFIPLLTKDLRLQHLTCEGCYVFAYLNSNAPPALKAGSKSKPFGELFHQLSDHDLALWVSVNVRRFFKYVPHRTLIDKFTCRLASPADTSVLIFNDFALRRGRVGAKVYVGNGVLKKSIQLTGILAKSGEIIQLQGICKDTGLLPIPVMLHNFGIQAGFDTLSFMLNFSNRSRHLAHIKGTCSFSDLRIKSKRLSTDMLHINHFSSDFQLHIRPHTFELDSGTRVKLNAIALKPYLNIDFSTGPGINFRLLPVTWNAGDFFSSLPTGMFTSICGMRASGNLHYFLDFYVNLSQPDSLLFNTSLKSDDFKIIRYGTDDYRLLNNDFQYHAYERGHLAASFLVGPENPDFVPFNQISPLVRASVMTSEDGSFFYHKGFNPGAFRESIAKNIVEGRFARGGSTLSMQLVKNVFLIRNKTIARKIEEALIVWLIENKSLVSKQRLYEVYLNIIEWGPGIYGIGPASRFYFNKVPSALTLPESVFLASIVPHPRWYKYTFVENGTPKPFFGHYFYRLRELMTRKNFLTPADTAGIVPAVWLTGNAALVFAAPDTLQTDSLMLHDLEFIPAM